MTKNNRFLVVQPDPDKAAQMRVTLRNDGGFEVFLIQSAMESIAAFSDHQPDQVILAAEGTEIPPEMLVSGFREMNPDARIWLCSDRRTEELESLRARLDAMGAVVLPITPEDCLYFSQASAEASNSGEDLSIDETMTDSSQELSSFNHVRGLPVQISARDLENRDSFTHQGHLNITGTLQNIARLEVTGDLTIEGDVIGAGIRCGGSLLVKGTVKWCREQGLFCRKIMEAGDVADSLLVCGNNFYLNGICRGSRVETLLRFIGKTENARLIGGHTRAGEYLEVACIGDADQTETLVELAPNRYFPVWARARLGLWERSMTGKSDHDRKRRSFERFLHDRALFLERACLRSEKIYSGLTIRIGEYEDYLFENYLRPVILNFGQKYKHRKGICIKDIANPVEDGAYRDVV